MAHYTCYIIGEGTLPIHCGELLQHNGHTIGGIITPDATLANWATDQGISCITPGEDMVAFLSRPACDFLFSIVNGTILRGEILTLPRRMAINYHDGPLPKYAGNHVTSWAIQQGEISHGITWHVMAERVDAGDILQQAFVPVNDDETTLTLNAKCYDAAIGSFRKLVEDITNDRLSPKKQDPTGRSFFPLFKRPADGCVISWQQPAEQIDRFVRGLDFGRYPNPLGLPKIAVNGHLAIVRKVTVLADQSTAPAGTITYVGDDALHVATTSHDIALQHLTALDGAPLLAAAFIEQTGFHAGQILPALTDRASAQLTARYQETGRHELFWVKRLADLHLLELPLSINRSPAGTARAAEGLTARVSLPEELFKQSGTPRGEVIFAAFLAFLARISDRSQFDIGFRVPSAQENLAELAAIFAETVPLPIRITDDAKFADICSAGQSWLAEVERRATYPTDITLRYPELSTTGNSRIPKQWPVVVEVVNELETSPETRPEALLTCQVAAHTGSAQFIFNPVGLAPDAANRFLTYFNTFVQGLANQPDGKLHQLTLLSTEEKHQLQVGWNGTDLTFPELSTVTEACVHLLFEAQVERWAGNLALIHANSQLTYQELNERANQLAHYLISAGVRPGTVVALCTERGPEMAVSLLAIMKAGGCYLALDPSYPEERLAFMLQDSQARFLLTTGDQQAMFPEHTGTTILLDQPQACMDPLKTVSPRVNVTGQDPVYLIYTSGSTGRPKGVLVPHQALANHSLAMRDSYQLLPEDRVLQFASTSFDVAAEEIYPTWLSGAGLVLRTDEALTSFTAFDAFLTKYELSVLNLPTPFWHEWVTAPQSNVVFLPESVRLAIVGSDQVSREHVIAWRQMVSDRVRWVNAYGPTETTITSTVYEPGAAGLPADCSVPIGRPIANTRVYILDRHLNLVPPGLPGEIYIGGRGLALGYFNQPRLTAERFVAHPFSNIPGERLYKTGDQARYLPDGNIEFLGRVDEQVKIRGFRIEPAEIEAILNHHPAVRESVVVAGTNGNGDKSLIAYLVPNHGTPPIKRTAIRQYLAEILPDYMVPAFLIPLDKLPTTSSGKLNRRALPPPATSHFTSPKHRPSSGTPEEQAMAKLWIEVLGNRRVGLNDNFFDLGGHSLQAVQLVSQINQHFGRTISTKTIFLHPSIRELTAALSDDCERPLKDGPLRDGSTKNGTSKNGRQIKQQSENGQVRISAWPGLRSTEFLQVKHRLLWPAENGSKPEPVEAAALYYLEDQGSRYEQLLLAASQGRPILSEIATTAWGRLALIILPRFIPELYSDTAGLLRDIVSAVDLADQLGARVVSLTGLIPSATDYGLAIPPALAKDRAWPLISTGHAATTSAVVLSLQRLLGESGRALSQERVGFLGLGSIGTASLHLMLNNLPHPAELLLCDLYSKHSQLEALRESLRQGAGYEGEIRLIESGAQVPAEFYEATLIVGATNVPDVLNIDQVRPGTLIVDDSGPHCFDVPSAIARFEQKQDILFTEGGVLRLPQAVRRVRFVPGQASEFAKPAFSISDPYEIMGCTFSSLLTAQYPDLSPTMGMINFEASATHLDRLSQLGIYGGRLNCEGYLLSLERILSFRDRFKTRKLQYA